MLTPTRTVSHCPSSSRLDASSSRFGQGGSAIAAVPQPALTPQAPSLTSPQPHEPPAIWQRGISAGGAVAFRGGEHGGEHGPAQQRLDGQGGGPEGHGVRPQAASALLTVGTQGSTTSHAGNPISVQDTFFRIGGDIAGKATNSLVVNAGNTLVDDIWAWRADHGNGGETIFFQNEMPYDPPSQAAWMNGSSDGYAAYEVAPGVTSHTAYGLGSYCYFNVNPAVVADHAFEAPSGSGIHFHDLLTVSLGGVGVIEHVINSTGGATPSNTTPVDVTSYP